MRHRKKLICVAVALAGSAVVIVSLGTYGEIGKYTLVYPPLEVESLEGATYFSSDYCEARERFRDAVQVARATTFETILHPHARDPRGGSLSVDVALFGPRDAENFLVIVSGTHGVEGFAGSAIQLGLVRENVVSSPPDDIAVLLIHALNPYGMANGRRFNENNVDLNRNFLAHGGPYPTNPDYEKLASAIAPKSVSFWSEVKSWWRLLSYRITHGAQALRAAVSRGQYSYADGLFFGGNSAAWSNQTLTSIADRYLSDTERVVVIDVHTGLGEFGDYEIILNDPAGSRVFQRAISIWGEGRVKSTFPSANERDHPVSKSAPVTGTLKQGFTETVNAEVTAVGLEFGTLPPLEVFKALRAENWLHHHGDNDPRAVAIRESLLRAFYPDSIEWKASVWNRGRGEIDKSLHWLMAKD
jgi:hypothetical protein